jgi:hypothetical protein
LDKKSLAKPVVTNFTGLLDNDGVAGTEFIIADILKITLR